MTIKGFQGTSLLDFPGRIAALVFYGGCNLRCPYCHNPQLIDAPDELPDYPEDELLNNLRRRRKFIDGVVISGGEPTLAPGLLPLLREIRALGLQIKLDTNGLRPAVLKAALAEGLLDYVAVDLKTLPERYGELGGEGGDIQSFAGGVTMLMASGVDYEFRTTCVPGWIDAETIDTLGKTINGARRWALQQFVPEHALDAQWHAVAAYPAARLQELAQRAEPYAAEVLLRGL
ncbi:MAG: anaerobic ribonucleoside-triphosphate reductase activating protein [Desulfuromonadaceae bacterium]|nr:anaerobic ribonucleoside-triphosphate reductase activating protein [Desulfuromonadaceae bacterium]